MSTELKTNTDGVNLTRFFGGESRGVCLNISRKKWDTTQPAGPWDQFFDNVQLTRQEAETLAQDLLSFAQGKEESLI